MVCPTATSVAGGALKRAVVGSGLRLQKVEYFHRWRDLVSPVHVWHRTPVQWMHPVRALVEWYRDRMGGVSMLDVGCGTATQWEYFSGGFYCGVDVTKKFLDCAKSMYNVDAELVNSSGGALPFRDSSFDVVTCKDLLEHLPPDVWRCFVREMLRVARLGVIIVFFNLRRGGTTRYRLGARGFYESVFALGDVDDLISGAGASIGDVEWGIGEPENQVVEVVYDGCAG